MAAGAAEGLLERERELTAFNEVLAEAGRGNGRVVLVEAPAGMGKTSLLKAVVATAAEEGVRVFAGPGQ